MTIQPKALAAFIEHARREYPRECCGVLVVKRGRHQYVPCSNMAIGTEHFILPAADYAAAEEQGQPIAICHSHPGAPPEPSAADRTACEATGLPWHIVRVDDPAEGREPELYTFQPSGYRAPLVGRPFAHGVLDCYTLIRDWYSQERGITLPDFPRRDDWWLGEDNLYMRHFPEAGFAQVSDGHDGIQPQVGDVILMQVRSPRDPNHAAVYIDDGYGWMLHHLHGRLSSREVYGGYWRDCTRAILRHHTMLGAA